MKRRALLLAAGTALAAPVLATPARAASACPPRLLASLPLRNVAGFLAVTVGIGATRCSLLLDTGADAGLLAPALADALALPRLPGDRARITGTGGGSATAPVAIIPALVLGDGLVLRHVPAPLGDLPSAPAIDPPVAGLLGADVLRLFAAEIDVAGGALRLWAPLPADAGPVGCVPPEARFWRALPCRFLGNRVAIAATLDGRPVTALLDTGARSRIVSPEAARVPPGVLDAEPGGLAGGVGGRERVYHWHRFASLAVAGEVARRPVLTVAPIGEPVDLLLGADWFATHAVWISYSTATVFIRHT